MQGISAPMLNSLLDELRQRSVITQEEEESVKAVPERMERARRVIDTVMNKGAEACSIMKNFLLVKDLFLSKDVGL